MKLLGTLGYVTFAPEGCDEFKGDLVFGTKVKGVFEELDSLNKPSEGDRSTGWYAIGTDGECHRLFLGDMEYVDIPTKSISLRRGLPIDLGDSESNKLYGITP